VKRLIVLEDGFLWVDCYSVLGYCVWTWLAVNVGFTHLLNLNYSLEACANFDALHYEINDRAVMESFLADMMAFDYNGWEPGRIPESVGLQEQRQHSLPSEGQWLMDCLLEGQFNEMGWQPIISFRELKESYLKWCYEHKINGYEIANSTILGSYLTKLAFKKRKMPNIEYAKMQIFYIM